MQPDNEPHRLKTWRATKKLTLEQFSARLAQHGVHLKPRSIQAIEYRLRRPDGSACFVFERLTGIPAKYYLTVALRPRSEKRSARKGRAA